MLIISLDLCPVYGCGQDPDVGGVQPRWPLPSLRRPDLE